MQVAKEAPLRFSLATLTSILCLAGIYFAAMGFPSSRWVTTTSTLTITIFAVTLVWQLTSPKADRTFWTGFQIAGWAYLAIVFAPQFSPVANASLLTPRILSYAHQKMPLSAPNTVAIEWQGTWYPGSILDRNGAQYLIHYSGYSDQWDEWVGPTRIRAGGINEFVQTGHALLALLVAAIGGIVAKSISHRRSSLFHIAMIVGIIGWFVFGLVALFYPNDIVTSIVFTVSLFVLIAITIGAVSKHESRSPLMIGAAVLGWCYFLIQFGPFNGYGNGPNLLTTWLATSLQELLHPPTMPVSPPQSFTGQPAFTGQPYTAVMSGSGYNTWQSGNPSISSFQIIFHSHLMLIAAAIGGWLGWFFSRRKSVEPK